MRPILVRIITMMGNSKRTPMKKQKRNTKLMYSLAPMTLVMSFATKLRSIFTVKGIRRKYTKADARIK